MKSTETEDVAKLCEDQDKLYYQTKRDLLYINHIVSQQTKNWIADRNSWDDMSSFIARAIGLLDDLGKKITEGGDLVESIEKNRKIEMISKLI